MGRFIRLAGWAVCLGVAVLYGWRVFAIATDPSVRAYAALVAVEGAFFGGLGVALVMLGRWLERRPADGTGAASRNRTLLAWLFRGQAVVAAAAGLWLLTAGEAADPLSPQAIVTACVIAVAGFAWWIALRLKRGMGTVPAVLYSGVSLLAFPVGTVLGGVQLLLLREISREAKAGGE